MKKRNIALEAGGAIGAAVGVKVLTRPDTVDFNKVADKVVHSDRSHFINIDGIRVNYQECGDAAGPPMILIHGYTASVYVWKTVAPMLADAGFCVLAIDLVGFGYSVKPKSYKSYLRCPAHDLREQANRWRSSFALGR